MPCPEGFLPATGTDWNPASTADPAFPNESPVALASQGLSGAHAHVCKDYHASVMLSTS